MSSNLQRNNGRVASILSALKKVTGGSINYISDIVGKTIAGELTISGLKTVSDFVFTDCTGLTAVSFPDAQYVGEAAFMGCTGLAEVNLPAVTTCYDSKSPSEGSFNGCTSLEAVNMPSLTDVPAYLMRGCKKLKKACFAGAASVQSYAFNGCTELDELDLPAATAISCMLFNGYSENNVQPRRLILRNTEDVCKITSYYRYLVGTSDELRIFVPRDLLGAYETSSYWKSHIGQFLALEDYTIDGTYTGEIDQNKVE